MTNSKTRPVATNGFQKWKDTLFWALLSIFLSGQLAWQSWITIELMDRPTENKTLNLIKTQTPYLVDRPLILKELNRVSKVIENNTLVVNDLRVTIAKMEK